MLEKKRRSRRLVLVGIALVFFVGAIGWAVEHFPWSRLPIFRLQEVEVRSEWPLTPELVRRHLPPLEGKSMLAVKPSELIALLENKPWVRTVTLKKEDPNRLFIDVATKTAAAVIARKGEPFFVDKNGDTIDRATPLLLRSLDLPIIQADAKELRWDLRAAMRALERLRSELEPEYRVSEIALEAPPYFRVYLAPVRAEVAFSLDSFDAQLPRLRLLLDSRSFPKWQPHRINLVFPKKAIVSAILSK